MKKLLIIFFFLSSLLFAEELAVNGGFETWNGNVPTGWSTIDAGITLTPEQTNFHSGTKSANVNVTTPTQADTDLRQSVSLVANNFYTISVWVYHTQGFLKARLYVAGTDNSGWQNYSDNTITNAWQQMTFSFTAATTGAAEVGLRFYDQPGFTGSEIVYLDDFSVNGSTGTDPAITVTSPNGGETWNIGGNYNITWTSANYTGNVNVKLVNTTNTETALATNIANGGTYAWTIANTIVAGSYTIKVEGTAGTPSDVSNATFLIAPAATVTEVNSIANLRSQTPDATIYRLTSEAILTYQQTFRNQKFIQDATGGILLDDFSGVLATQFSLGDGLTGLTGTLVNYNSMMEFVPTANLTAPSSTNNLITPEVISYTDYTTNFMNYQSRLVKIENVHFETASGSFAIGTEYNVLDAANNVFVFRTNFYDANYIGSVVPDGNYDLICIPQTRSTGNSITARSLADFIPHTTEEMINIVAPNGGETWVIGEEETISWVAANISGNVFVEFMQGDNVLNTWTVPASQGSISEVLPSDVPPGTNYRVRISDAEDGQPSDISAGYFSIIEAGNIPRIVISEIMYNPASALGLDDDYEYVELYNSENNSVDLSGWYINTAFEYVFPAATVVPANGYLVVARNPQPVMSSYGITNVVGPFASGNMNNTGETIKLYTNANQLVDEVAYSASAPWPLTANGQGPSLELVALDLDNSLPENWQASWLVNGTPGAANSVEPNITDATIHAVQFTESETGTSEYVGQRVRVSGTITANFSTGSFVQDGEGAWSGIFVNQPFTQAVGTRVQFVASVVEQYNRTTLTNVTDITSLGAGEPIIAAPVNTGAINEMYEGVLVTVNNAEATTAQNEYNEWSADDGSGAIIIDDLGYNYVPTLHQCYGITGVVDYAYTAFRIYPRTSNDVVPCTPANNNSEVPLFTTLKNYPNPFNPLTTICFSLPAQEQAEVTIYDVKGQKVANVFSGVAQKGENKFVFSGKNMSGKAVASGVYFCRLKTDRQTKTIKMLMLK